MKKFIARSLVVVVPALALGGLAGLAHPIVGGLVTWVLIIFGIDMTRARPERGEF